MIADLQSKKIITLRFRSKPRHDMKDVFYLLKKVKNVEMLIADKGYDSESIHEYAFWNKFITIIPKKANARKGFFRKKMQKHFSYQIYHRRSIIESMFFMIKRKYGEISSLKFKNQRADIYCRAIAHNITLMNLDFFS